LAEIRAYVFDAYGTLFDVHSVVEAGRAVAPDPVALSAVWRQKQLEYTWLGSLMGRYQDFWAVTESALRFALRKLGLAASSSQVAALMESYLSLACFPEVRTTLERIQDRPVAILSNGSPRMLESAVRSSGLAPLIRHVLSVDAVKTYKPSPAVYALGPKALGLPPQRVLFVSSNAWDAAGAKAFGYQVCWCNRTQAPAEELGLPPDYIIDRLDQIPR
jgi:2-haloacid dehalogenase